MIKLTTKPRNIKPTYSSIYTYEDVKHEREASSGFLTPQQVKEYQQLVKILTVKNYTL